MIKIKEIGFSPIDDNTMVTELIMGIFYRITCNNEIFNAKYQLVLCIKDSEHIVGYYKTVEKAIEIAQDSFEGLIKDWIEE